MLNDQEIRERLAARLRLARGKGSVHASGSSGVGHQTISRLERGANGRVDLSTVYALARHYGVSLAGILDVGGRPSLAGLGRWPARALPYPAIEVRVRRQVREARIGAGRGTPWTAARVGVSQSWLVRLEAGDVSIDVIRLLPLTWFLELDVQELLNVHNERGETDDDPDRAPDRQDHAAEA